MSAVDDALKFAKELRSYDELEQNLELRNRRGKVAMGGLLDYLFATYKVKCEFEYKDESMWSKEIDMTEDATLWWGGKDNNKPIPFEVKATHIKATSSYFLSHGYWYLRPSGIQLVMQKEGRLYMSTPDRFVLMKCDVVMSKYPEMLPSPYWGKKPCYAIPKEDWMRLSKEHITELKIPRK